MTEPKYISIKEAAKILHMSEKGLQKHVVSSYSQIRSVRQGNRRMLNMEGIHAYATKRGYGVPASVDAAPVHEDDVASYITAQEAAELLHTSPNSVHKAIARPNAKIRSIKQNGRRLFHRDDVLARSVQQKHGQPSIQPTPALVGDDAEYMGVHEVAQLLNISMATVWRRAKKPNWSIRMQRNGKKILFYRGDVEALAQGTSAHAPVDLPAPPQATAVESIPSDPLILVRDLQAQLFAAHQQIGELRTQLATRLTQEDERVLRDEVVAYKTRLDAQVTPLSTAVASVMRP